MIAAFSQADIRVLNQLSVLNPESKRELHDYLEFMVARQCRNEFKSQLLNNNWLFNNLLALTNLNDNGENYCEEVLERLRRMKGLCQSVFEQLTEKYGGLLGEIKGYEGIAEGMMNSLLQIQEAAQAGDPKRTKNEILDMFESYKSAGRGNRPKVRAM
ncbi:MAG: hypothetical protein HPY50_01530 [Firmicutes bacterium]|nr:hypothetical protein [Bacillota bacterium]